MKNGDIGEVARLEYGNEEEKKCGSGAAIPVWFRRNRNGIATNFGTTIVSTCDLNTR